VDPYKYGTLSAAPRTPRADIDQFVDLLRLMLKLNPLERPSAEEVLKHPWFADQKETAVS
jgi:serine/threonine protein kinase